MGRKLTPEMHVLLKNENYSLSPSLTNHVSRGQFSRAAYWLVYKNLPSSVVYEAGCMSKFM